MRPGGRRRFAALVVAGGAHRVATVPSLPGEFAGDQVVVAGAALRGRDVIVAGAGREACDVAVAASYVARSTRLSIRRAPYMLPQIAFGRPLDRSPLLPHLLGKGLGRGRVTARLPRSLRQRLLGAGYRALTSTELHGLPSPTNLPGVTGAVPATDLLERLLHGRIEIRPAIERLAGDGVVFADGSVARADLIVWCTGSRRLFPFLPATMQPRGHDRLELVLQVLPAATPSLAFLGLVDPVGGSPARIAEAQAELVAAHLDGDYELPRGVQGRHGSRIGRPPGPSAHRPQVEQFDYMRRLKGELHAGRRRARRR